MKDQKNPAGIMSIPETERPYEKCWMYGAQALSDAELLAVILRSGSREESSLELARRILYKTGEQGLSGLYHLSVEDLMSLRGIGKVKAIQLKCLTEISGRLAKERTRSGVYFHGPSSIAEYYMEQMRRLEQEKVLLVFLDSKNGLTGQEFISAGTVNASMISPREVYRIALSRRAVGIVLLHNHPSGDPTPSNEDVSVTIRIRESGELVGIPLLDHIVIGDGTYVSIREAYPSTFISDIQK